MCCQGCGMILRNCICDMNDDAAGQHEDAQERRQDLEREEREQED